MPFKRIWRQPQVLAALRAGASVVTSGERLARAVHLAYAEERAAAGVRVWERPAVFSFGVFVGELYERAFAAALSAGGRAPPRRMPETAAEAIWERCVWTSAVGDELLQPAATAREANEAWKICSYYRIPVEQIEAAEDEDARQFASWARKFTAASREQGALEDARLTDWLIGELHQERLRGPARILWAGFDALTRGNTGGLRRRSR